MEAVWTKRAKSSYWKIRDHIRHHFSEVEEATFVDEVFKTVSAIENFPKAFPETNLKRIKSSRKAVIHPHSTLFYRVESRKRVRLLLFWDNRNDIKKIK